MIILALWIIVKIKKAYIYWLTLMEYSLCSRNHVKHSRTPKSCETGTETQHFSEKTEAQNESKLLTITQLVNQAPDLCL